MLFLVHYIPGLLKDIRAEVDIALIIDEDKKEILIDITTIKNSCPLLLSIFKETLRYWGMGTAMRVMV
jgi:hypothetical protein